jgi:hypothetical protein
MVCLEKPHMNKYKQITSDWNYDASCTLVSLVFWDLKFQALGFCCAECKTLREIKQQQPKISENDTCWWLSATGHFLYEELFRVGSSGVPIERDVIPLRRLGGRLGERRSKEVIIRSTKFTRIPVTTPTTLFLMQAVMFSLKLNH